AKDGQVGQAKAADRGTGWGRTAFEERDARGKNGAVRPGVGPDRENQPGRAEPPRAKVQPDRGGDRSARPDESKPAGGAESRSRDDDRDKRR
ncbi:MAG: hypothetical protein M3Q10_19925, partial [Chloroflexota bacterium]|nr:hypothetical protein [Chloroflexota bacterium]